MNQRLSLLSDRWQDRVGEAVTWLTDRGFLGTETNQAGFVA